MRSYKLPGFQQTFLECVKAGRVSIGLLCQDMLQPLGSGWNSEAVSCSHSGISFLPSLENRFQTNFVVDGYGTFTQIITLDFAIVRGDRAASANMSSETAISASADPKLEIQLARYVDDKIVLFTADIYKTKYIAISHVWWAQQCSLVIRARSILMTTGVMHNQPQYPAFPHPFSARQRKPHSSPKDSPP